MICPYTGELSAYSSPRVSTGGVCTSSTGPMAWMVPEDGDRGPCNALSDSIILSTTAPRRGIRRNVTTTTQLSVRISGPVCNAFV